MYLLLILASVMSIYICVIHDYPRLQHAYILARLRAKPVIHTLFCLLLYVSTYLLVIVFFSITFHNLKLHLNLKPLSKSPFIQTSQRLLLISTTTNPFFCLSILIVYQTQPLLLIVTNESNQRILAQRRDYFDKTSLRAYQPTRVYRPLNKPY